MRLHFIIIIHHSSFIGAGGLDYAVPPCSTVHSAEWNYQSLIVNGEIVSSWRK